MKRTLLGLLGVAGLAAGFAVASNPGTAADHLEAPIVQLDGRTDINDVYVFQSPESADKTVLVMTVNPVAGVLSPTTFAPDANYRFFIDNDGDAKKDETIRVKFGEVESDGSQSVRINGAAGRATGTTGSEITLPGGGRAMVGTYDDPFFFDFQAFLDQVKGSGGPRTFCDGGETDFFAGLNVSAIVLEMPTSSITGDSSSVGVWAETTGGAGRIDRMGRPTIATVLVDDGSEDAFNQTRPHNDLAQFGDQVRDNLLALSGLDGTGYTVEEAEAVTAVLLPDILTVDTASTAGYLNGRGLSDDVIDTNLAIVTGGLGSNGTPVLTGDCVDSNDVAFPSSFPYLAPAHS